MFFKLLLGFTLIPLAELYLLIEVGGRIGGWNTIGLVLLTGFVGAYLARLQGFQTMMKVRASLNQGQMPAEEMFDAFLILVAGIVLFTPGFITDTLGILLLIPPVRAAFKRWLRKKCDEWMRSGAVTVVRYGQTNQPPFGPFDPTAPHGRAEPRDINEPPGPRKADDE